MDGGNANTWHDHMSIHHIVVATWLLPLLEIQSFATSHYATDMQLNVYNINTCHKNDGLNLYILKLLYLIYLHRLCIIILCAFSTKVNPMLT